MKRKKENNPSSCSPNGKKSRTWCRTEKNAALIIMYGLCDAIFLAQFCLHPYNEPSTSVCIYERLIYEPQYYPQRLGESELILLFSAVIGCSLQEDRRN